MKPITTEMAKELVAKIDGLYIDLTHSFRPINKKEIIDRILEVLQEATSLAITIEKIDFFNQLIQIKQKIEIQEKKIETIQNNLNNHIASNK